MAFAVRAHLCGSKANETAMGAVLFNKMVKNGTLRHMLSIAANLSTFKLQLEKQATNFPCENAKGHQDIKNKC